MADRFTIRCAMCVLAVVAIYAGTTSTTRADDDTLTLKFTSTGDTSVADDSSPVPSSLVPKPGRGTLALTGANTFVGDPLPRPGRPWGPEQATGAPNTPRAGDIHTAWASRTQDNQDEWLVLEYAQPVQPIAILVYETYKPGAVSEIAAFTPEGREVILWQGTDPTDRSADKGISVIPVQPSFAMRKIRLRIDSTRVPDWNEIDAVGLLDAQGRTHWAVAATASSTYADVIAENPPQPARSADSNDQRLRRLESEIRQLRNSVDGLRRALEENRRNRERQPLQ